MDLPVTLVIKAPSQSIGDQTIDCMLGWTVRKLKQHLTDVYPSKPSENHQKLIYSGKLLQDHLTLKEVLRQFEDGSSRHTVHLVCSSSPAADMRPTSAYSEMTHSRQSSSSSDNSQYSLGSPDTEGLRLRSFRNSAPSTSLLFTPSLSTQNVFTSYSPSVSVGQMPLNINQYMASLSPESFMMGSMVSPGGKVISYSPEQYMWMQQLYAQYMAQYMQFYQQQNLYTTPPNMPETTTVPPEIQPNNVQHANVNAAAEGEEADEDFRQRDWLDCLYIFSRLLVLLGIMYFYSSFTRFLLVGLFFLVMYIYRVGWQVIYSNRRRGDREQNRQNDQQQNNAQAIPDQENPVTTASAPAEVQQHRQPGVFQILWTFLSMFFLSLFPGQAPAVNAN